MTTTTGRMTIDQVVRDMRRRGIPIGQKTLSDGIANGTFPFGSVISVGETGRRTVMILSKAYYQWADEKLGPYIKEVPGNA